MSQWRKALQRNLSGRIDSAEYVQIRRTRPDNGAFELFATIAKIPFEFGGETRYAVGIAKKGPRDSACRKIGRQIAEGRALRTVAELYEVIEAPVKEKFNTRGLMSLAQYDMFVDLARANPEQILTHRRTVIKAEDILADSSIETVNA